MNRRDTSTSRRDQGSVGLPLAPSKGLDLNDPEVYGLAKRIYYKRFNVRVRWLGIDEDDGFQDVIVGLLRRQKGKSRFDPDRSSLSNYLFMAMSSITRNMAESARCRPQHVQRTSLRDERGGDHVGEDWAEGGITPVSGRALEDLAAEMEVPLGVVRALADGDDPVMAALDAGMDPTDAVRLADALGVR
jgi:hypothetical protein